MTIIITLSFAGNETGPFDLYSDATNFATPFAQGISKAALLAGFQVNAPAGTTVVRLDDLSGLCLNTETDIYTCATPNCDFAGEILCNITTTTTTSSSSTTTTSTTYFPDPFGIPCLWSTDGGNSGSVAVYNFNTNTSTTVLVPNDFTETVGIERPICATEDKLWLASIVDQGSNPTNDNDDKVYIREWDIDGTTPNAPTLTYVREITVPMGQTYAHNLGGTSVWAMTAIDNNTLIVGTGNEYAPAPSEGTGGTGSIYLSEFSIATVGNITISSNDISSKWAATPASNTGKLSNLTYTNSGQLILGYRVDLTPSGGGQQSAVGNYLVVFPVTPSSPEFSINNQVIPKILLQDYGLPEFSESYNGAKDVPFWGVNGLAQILQPETLEVYTVNQSIPNNLTSNIFVNSSNDWLSSATSCSNINFISGDPDPNCGLTYFPNLFDGLYDSSNNNYLGPQTFTYFGMTCTASLSNDLGAWFVSNTDGGFLGCSGLTSPDSEGENVLLAVQGFDFSITIDFPVAVNDIPIRASVLNSSADGTAGDVYYVETNGGTPTLSINDGCLVQVDGNKLWGGMVNPNLPGNPVVNNSGDGEFKVTSLANYTSMTIYGNAPTGGKLFLGCAVPPLNCRLVYSTDSAGNSCLANPGRCLPGQNSFKKYFAWDVNTNTQQEILLPSNTATNSPNFALSENYIIVDVPSFVTGVKSLARYGYTDINGIPSDTTFDGQFIDYPVGDVRSFGFIMEAVTDTKFLGIWLQNFSQPFPTAVSQILEWELSGTTLSYSVKIDVGVNHGYVLQGDLVLTFKTDGTPNKIIAVGYVPPLQPDNSNPAYLLQFDYTTNALDGVVNLPAGVRGTASLGIYDGGIYIASSDNGTVSPELAGVWRFDLETLQWTQLDPADVPVEMGLPSRSPDDFASTPICRVSDGITSFGPSPTTTTSSTTPNPSGPKTIWTWFESEINQ